MASLYRKRTWFSKCDATPFSSDLLLDAPPSKKRTSPAATFVCGAQFPRPVRHCRKPRVEPCAPALSTRTQRDGKDVRGSAFTVNARQHHRILSVSRHVATN